MSKPAGKWKRYGLAPVFLIIGPLLIITELLLLVKKVLEVLSSGGVNVAMFAGYLVGGGFMLALGVLMVYFAIKWIRQRPSDQAPPQMTA